MHMIDPEHIVDVARSLSANIREILPPLVVLTECRRRARTNKRLSRRVIGLTELGSEIEAYQLGTGEHAVLFYGFPDPGEAVGGTSISTLIDALLTGNDFLSTLGVSWHFIPCLNLDDQPDQGRSLQTVFRRPDIREVDWCVDDPRPETRALLDYARATQPVFTYPLHDEYHCGESLPLYFCCSDGKLTAALNGHLIAAAKAFGLAVSHEDRDNSLPMVIEMASSLDFSRSTFARISEYGPVFISEVSRQEGVSAAGLVGAQLAFGIMALLFTLRIRNTSAESRIYSC